jgi:hypothetical protein
VTTDSVSTRETQAGVGSEPEAARQRRRGLLLRRLPWWAEILVAVGFYFLYDSVQALAGSDRDKAFQNGRDIVAAEKHLHIWIEPHFNRWLTNHHTFGLVAGYDYGLAHALVTATVLGFVWWRRPAVEPWLRNALVAMSLVALVVYWLYPVAPPRMTVPTLTDTLLTDNVLGARHVHQGLVNLYAAMPSLHVAWALWCAAAVVFSLRSRWRQLAWLYPLWTTFVIISTANHYLLDAFAGAVLAGVPLLWIARRLRASASGPLPVVSLEDGKQVRGRAGQDSVDA